jgi:5-hydroxyisourate hydrolase-like protein (transthyretin family)
VDGGEIWRNGNAFAVRWQNPAPDGAAPVAGAEYQLCRAQGGSCTRGARSGDRLSAIADLKVPAAGDWVLQLWLRDAAGNQDSRNTAGAVHLRFDDSAPAVTFAPLDPSDPTLVVASASDAVSGVAQAQIELRRRGSDTWQLLPTSHDGRRMTARIDDELLARGVYELRAHAVDAAGNERTTSTLADGQLATVALPLRLGTRFQRAGLKHGRNGSASMARRVRVAYGHGVRIRGRLATAQGNPVPEVDVLVYSHARRRGASTHLVATLKTSRRGGFSYRAPKGVSRTIEFRYSGTPTIRGAT